VKAVTTDRAHGQRRAARAIRLGISVCQATCANMHRNQRSKALKALCRMLAQPAWKTVK
jgi:hypothetical protein